MRIAKTFEFSAAHHLAGLPAGHPCERNHGHNYVVTVVLEGQVDDVGMVVDYRRLDAFKNWLAAHVDHRDLNEVVPANPTAENIAAWLFDFASATFPQVSAVRVSETPKTWAEFTRGDR